MCIVRIVPRVHATRGNRVASLNSFDCLNQPLLVAKTMAADTCIENQSYHTVKASAQRGWWTPQRLVVSQLAGVTFACLRYPAWLQLVPAVLQSTIVILSWLEVPFPVLVKIKSRVSLKVGDDFCSCSRRLAVG